MCHAFTRSVKSKSETTEKGCMWMDIKQVSAIRTLYTGINIKHVLLKHHVGFHNYNGEIPNLQIGNECIIQPNIFLTTRQKLSAQSKAFVIA